MLCFQMVPLVYQHCPCSSLVCMCTIFSQMQCQCIVQLKTEIQHTMEKGLLKMMDKRGKVTSEGRGQKGEGDCWRARHPPEKEMDSADLGSRKEELMKMDAS